MKLRDLIATLKSIYCGTIGAEFMHIQNPRVRDWVRERIEGRPTEYTVPPETQRRMLRQILSVESFEHFLHTRYVGQKRFSLEGGESLIAALYALLENSPQARGGGDLHGHGPSRPAERHQRIPAENRWR